MNTTAKENGSLDKVLSQLATAEARATLVYHNVGEMQISKDYITKAVDYFMRNHNQGKAIDIHIKSKNYAGIVAIYLKDNKLEKAIKYAEKSNDSQRNEARQQKSANKPRL